MVKCYIKTLSVNQYKIEQPTKLRYDLLERKNGAAYGGNQIQRMMLCASHSPVLDYADESREPVQRILAAFDDVQERIRRFDPDLIVMFGVDHYGGHRMNCMPSFTI